MYKQLRDYVGEDRIDIVFKILSSHEDEYLKNKDWKNHYFLLKGEYRELIKRRNLGLRNIENSMNELRYKLLKFIDLIEGEIDLNEDVDIFPTSLPDIEKTKNHSKTIKLTILGIPIIGLTIAGIAGFPIGTIFISIVGYIFVIIAVWLYFKVFE